MSKECQVRCVSCDAAIALYYARSALFDRLSQVDASVVSVNSP
jgi:hypothetical protein